MGKGVLVAVGGMGVGVAVGVSVGVGGTSGILTVMTLTLVKAPFAVIANVVVTPTGVAMALSTVRDGVAVDTNVRGAVIGNVSLSNTVVSRVGVSVGASKIAGTGVSVSVDVSVAVGVSVAVFVGSGVSVGTGVKVDVLVGVAVGVSVGVFVGVAVSVGVGVGVKVGVAVAKAARTSSAGISAIDVKVTPSSSLRRTQFVTVPA